jgi:tryptophan-rich sensory protein
MRARKAATLAAFVLVAFLPSAVAAFFRPGGWYETLAKPAWNPPGWVFGPVWTILYLLIGVSGYLAWASPSSRSRTGPFLVYGAQLFLNALWSVLFFGLHDPGLAFADLAALWIAIAANIALFWRLDRTSALLLVPYFAWTSFAGALNLVLWRLNT